MMGYSLDKTTLDNICLEIDANYQVDEPEVDKRSVSQEILKWVRLEGEMKVKELETQEAQSSRSSYPSLYSGSRYARRDLEDTLGRYDNFIDSYIKLKEKYNSEKGKLFCKRDMLGTKKPFSAGRLALDALVGGFIGSFFSGNYSEVIGAGIAVSFGAYSELTKEKPSLSPISWGVIGGGFIGSFFNGQELGHLPGYIGAAIGGIIGLARSINEGKKGYKLQFDALENEFKALDLTLETEKKGLYRRYGAI